MGSVASGVSRVELAADCCGHFGRRAVGGAAFPLATRTGGSQRSFVARGSSAWFLIGALLCCCAPERASEQAWRASW
eukprot:8841009-Alexandrium_andersonii.AAC.1